MGVCKFWKVIWVNFQMLIAWHWYYFENHTNLGLNDTKTNYISIISHLKNMHCRVVNMKSFTQWLKLRLFWSFQRLFNTQSFFLNWLPWDDYIKLYGQIVDFLFFFIFRKHLRRKIAAARTILQWMDIRGALWHVTAPPTPWPSTECWYPTDKRNFIKRAIEILKTFSRNLW